MSYNAPSSEGYSSAPSTSNNPVYEHPAASNNTSNGAATNLQSTKDSILNTASSTMSSIQNNPNVQSAKESVVNGPVGQAVQQETAKTSSEFQDLADSRKVPEQPAATGQPLTHYHSLFYRLLSWKNPRATGITFATVVALIFAARYLDVLRYTLKGLYTVLGITALAEVAGKVALGNGLASQVRPKKYYTIRKESLERFLDDVEQLINFVVIEFQRVLFVENIWATVTAFAASFVSYFLIKLLPLWGLTLLATTVTFITPLVYLSNQEFIDEHLNHAGRLVSAQATQVRDLAAHHTNTAIDTTRSYAGDYSQKAQELISSTRQKVNGTASNTSATNTPSTNTHATNPTTNTSTTTDPTVNRAEFPTAPKTEPAGLNGRTFEPQYAQ